VPTRLFSSCHCAFKKRHAHFCLAATLPGCRKSAPDRGGCLNRAAPCHRAPRRAPAACNGMVHLQNSRSLAHPVALAALDFLPPSPALSVSHSSQMRLRPQSSAARFLRVTARARTRSASRSRACIACRAYCAHTAAQRALGFLRLRHSNIIADVARAYSFATRCAARSAVCCAAAQRAAPLAATAYRTSHERQINALASLRRQRQKHRTLTAASRAVQNR